MDYIETVLDIPCVSRITPRLLDSDKIPKCVRDPYGYHPEMGPDPYNKLPNRDCVYVICNEDGTKENIEGIEYLAFYFGLKTIRQAETLLKKKQYKDWGVVDIKKIHRKRSNKGKAFPAKKED